MNFLIIRLSSLGDIIHTLPAFSTLRQNFPDAEISWVVEEKGKEILDMISGIDHTFVLRTKESGRPLKSLRLLTSDLKQLYRKSGFITLDFQGLLKSGLLSFLSGARRRIGFNRKNCREKPASLFYTERAEKMPESIHVIQKNLNLLQRIGIHEKRFEFPIAVPETISTAVREKMKHLGFHGTKKLVLLNIGAAWETKRWFKDRWIKLIEILRDPDLFFVLLWGNPKEKQIAEEISRSSGVSLAPPLSIKEVMALVQSSGLIITGDTFALQASCALNRPVVALFGPTNPKRNGPFNPQDKVVFHPPECGYCYKRRCASLECLLNIQPEEVAARAEEMLKTDERIHAQK